MPSSLPVELLDEILPHAAAQDRSIARSLSATSKATRAFALPYLYQTISLTSLDQIRRFSLSISQRTGSITRRLWISSSIFDQIDDVLRILEICSNLEALALPAGGLAALTMPGVSVDPPPSIQVTLTKCWSRLLSVVKPKSRTSPPPLPLYPTIPTTPLVASTRPLTITLIDTHSEADACWCRLLCCFVKEQKSHPLVLDLLSRTTTLQFQSSKFSVMPFGAKRAFPNLRHIMMHVSSIREAYSPSVEEVDAQVLFVLPLEEWRWIEQTALDGLWALRTQGFVDSKFMLVRGDTASRKDEVEPDASRLLEGIEKTFMHPHGIADLWERGALETALFIKEHSE